MDFNVHSDLIGKHAFLSASGYHWVNYSEDKLVNRYATFTAAQRGSELHELAHNLIRLGVKLPKNNQTLNQYVNDAIGLRMRTEQPLFYSRNCFGTADAIKFSRDLLRVHDLKNGTLPVKFTQLLVYDALFCLEYGVRPGDIEIENRIYQNDEVEVYRPEVDEIVRIMDKIVMFDKRIERLREAENRD